LAAIFVSANAESINQHGKVLEEIQLATTTLRSFLDFLYLWERTGRPRGSREAAHLGCGAGSV
jgi:hypothetical protein